MRVMVALEGRFVKTQNGSIYSNYVYNYSFFKRYLHVFDEVVVCARVAEITENKLDLPCVNGPNVSFYPMPTFIGPWQFLKLYPQLNKLLRRATEEAEVFILRVPGTISTVLWRHLRRRNILYGVEVVGDPWEGLAVGNVVSIFRPMLRRVGRSNMRRQCYLANAAAYVTEYILQRRYPPSGWSTHYSSIDLPVEAIADERRLSKRFLMLDDAINGRRPFRVLHAGTMDALYKGQDILIEAVSVCCNNGFRIELTLLGDGRYLEYFVKKAKRFGIYKNVKFLGRLATGLSVLDQLDSSDLFVLPSTTEGLPQVMIEAMARGLPCIGTNVGGIPELLSGEQMFPIRDVKSLVGKMQWLMQNKSKLIEFSLRGVEVARKYCLSEIQPRRIAFYKRLSLEAVTCRNESSQR